MLGLRREGKSVFLFWIFAFTCGAGANVLAFWIFARLKPLGFERKWWRAQDFSLFLTYWRLAPHQGWSRLPLVAFFVLSVVAFTAGLVAYFAATPK
jgi:hypothetical protein